MENTPTLVLNDNVRRLIDATREQDDLRARWPAEFAAYRFARDFPLPIIDAKPRRIEAAVKRRLRNPRESPGIESVFADHLA